MTGPSLSTLGRRLVGYYASSLRHERAARFLDFSFSSGSPRTAATIRVACFELPCTAGPSLWFSGSLGPPSAGGHSHEFVGIFDSPSPALSELVAATKHFDAFLSPLNTGHTFPLGSLSALRQLGYCAALVLEGSFYGAFERWNVLLSGFTVAVFSVLPISAFELELKKASGIDALLEHWDSNGRDLLHVPPEVPV